MYAPIAQAFHRQDSSTTASEDSLPGSQCPFAMAARYRISIPPLDLGERREGGQDKIAQEKWQVQDVRGLFLDACGVF